MENASKALIIAGAILISILLISVGILVMQSATGVTGEMEGRMDATAIQSFNAPFENYVGTRRGSIIKNLITDVSASNTSHPEDQISITLNGVEQTDFSALQRNISSTARYNISVNKNDRGLVNQIVLEGVSAGTTPTGGGTGSTP